MRDLKSLKMNEAIRQEYTVRVRNKFGVLPDESDAEEQWSRLQDAINGAADEIIPHKESGWRQEWMTEVIPE